MAVAIRGSCRHCGGSFIIQDGEGEYYCLLCGRPYEDHRDHGRLGGLQTLMRYGREHFSEIGKRGGRPRLRQLPVPKTENNVREGMAAQPNNLRVLKELWRQRREELLAASSSSQGE